ncbi:MAG: DUF1848 domain-containing protein [Acidobacteriota bacterium]
MVTLTAEKRTTVISASRRTDIPAFHTGWFLEQIRKGKTSYTNPFGGTLHTVSLKPEDVHSIVFWSRDYSRLLPHLGELEEKGFCFYFHFTITGHPVTFDRNVINVNEAINQFRTISRRYSPNHVHWRFDPLIISDISDAGYLIERFAELARELKGYTKRCYTSFVQYYGKVKRNLKRLEEETGIHCYDLPVDEKIAIAGKISRIAADNGMKLLSCCCDYLIGGLIEKAHCIDGDLLRELFPERSLTGKVIPTRKGCGCFSSRDIGTYDTCSHGCLYCYANANPMN